MWWWVIGGLGVYAVALLVIAWFTWYEPNPEKDFSRAWLEQEEKKYDQYYWQ